MVANWQRAFVLHRRLYRESSLLVDFFTEQSGRITAIAKGARSPRSTLKGILQPFTPLLILFSGQQPIKVLRQAEAISLTLPLTDLSLYSGFYINELLSRLLAEGGHDDSQLFWDYLQCIKSLAENSSSPEAILRLFELSLLHHLGYGLDFEHCYDSGQPIEVTEQYCYQPGKGFKQYNASQTPPLWLFSGAELQALAQRHFPNKLLLQAAKRFCRLSLQPLLGNKPLKSRELFL